MAIREFILMCIWGIAALGKLMIVAACILGMFMSLALFAHAVQLIFGG